MTTRIKLIPQFSKVKKKKKKVEEKQQKHYLFALLGVSRICTMFLVVLCMVFVEMNRND